MHCTRSTLSPYDYDWTCISCGYNVMKRKKNELGKISKKKNFINRLKYAEKKILCTCIDTYKIIQGDDIKEMTVRLTRIKNKKLKMN